jgi:Fe-S-cluster containining protein
MDVEHPAYVDIDHPAVQRVDSRIFRIAFVEDCMEHACRCRDEGDRLLPDACCQHGADVDLFERDAILRRAPSIASVIAGEFRDPARWFDAREPEADPETPSGTLIRTGLVDLADEASGCVFLQHDGRGCALHRAALADGFDPAEIKPQVCRLYPLTFGDGRLELSDDWNRYSCAQGGPKTIYRVMRDTVADVLGVELVRKLDRVERQVRPRRLPLLATI